MTIETTRNGDVEIAYETVGSGEPMLLIMGTGGQMLAWHPDFCAELVRRGFQVIRFDNRDSGLSTRFTARGAPNPLMMWLRPQAAAAYRLEDMAADAVAVIDAAGHRSAHVVGLSQGGMIAQVLATRFPERVRSLTSIASTPWSRIGRTAARDLLGIAKAARRPVTSGDDLARQTVELLPFTGSPEYPADEAELAWLREVARQSYDRGGYDLAAIQRHTAAVAAAGDRRAELADVTAPTLVVHGGADRMIGPAGGRATAEAIPGARLLELPGAGHGVPPALVTRVVDAIVEVARTSRSGPAADSQDSGLARGVAEG